jgi:hypothetical protein
MSRTPTGLWWDGMSRTPTGLYSKIMQETSNPEILRKEATKQLQLMQTLAPPTYGNINYIKTPVPMLIQVPVQTGSGSC